MKRLYPIEFTHFASKKRTASRNWQLGILLAFVAGHINAGGYFIVRHYTSHMTGIVSEAADELALGEITSAGILTSFLLCFVAGAALTTLIILTARRRCLHAQFGLPLLLEALLIVIIVLFCQRFQNAPLLLPLVTAALCFLMGLQNAIITKASTAIVRTTHMTGLATDLGIEIGRLLVGAGRTGSDSSGMRVLLFGIMILAFLTGGVAGALAVTRIGAAGLLPVSLILAAIALPTLARDLRFAVRRARRQAR